MIVTAHLQTRPPQPAEVAAETVAVPASSPKPLAQFGNHRTEVRGVAFSPDDKQFVTIGWDRMINLYDLPTRQLVRSWSGHEQGLYRARFLPDGRLLTCAYDGSIKLWDVSKPQELKSFAGHTGPVTALAVSADGKRAISAGYDKTVRWWDLEKLEAIGTPHSVKEGDWIWDADISPNGESAATVGFDGKIRLWSAATGEPAGEIAAHQGPTLSIIYTGDGKVLSGGRDGAIRLWDTTSKSKIGERTGFSGLWIEDLSISKDGRRALVGLANPDKQPELAPLAGQCAVLDVESMQILGYLPTGAPYIYTTAISSDGLLALTGGGRGGQPASAQLWDLSAALKTSPAPSSKLDLAITEVLQIDGHREHVSSLAVTGDGKTVFSGSADGTVLGRDVNPRLNCRVLSGHRRDREVAVVVSRDGRLIVTGDGDGKLRLLRPGTAGVKEIDAHPGGVMSVKLSQDESTILSTGCDNTAKVWNPESGELIHTLQGHTGWVCDGDYSANWASVVTASFDETIRVWDAATGREMRKLPTQDGIAHTLAWSKVRNYVAAGFRDGTVRLFDPDKGIEVKRFIGHTDRVRDVAFTPDGRHLVSGSYDKTLRVWNIQTGQEVARAEHEKHIFNALAIAPDGRHVFSAGGIWKPDEKKDEWTPENDYAVRMWRLPAGVSPALEPAAVAKIKHTAQLEGHGGPVFGLAVAADGRTALSTSDEALPNKSFATTSR